MTEHPRFHYRSTKIGGGTGRPSGVRRVQGPEDACAFPDLLPAQLRLLMQRLSATQITAMFVGLDHNKWTSRNADQAPELVILPRWQGQTGQKASMALPYLKWYQNERPGLPICLPLASMSISVASEGCVMKHAELVCHSASPKSQGHTGP